MNFTCYTVGFDLLV